MARNKGTFSLPANFEVKLQDLLDPRGGVDKKSDLINKESFPYDGNTIYMKEGMLVTVREERAIYMLVDITNITNPDYSGWERKDSTGSSGSTGGSNLDLATAFSEHNRDENAHPYIQTAIADTIAFALVDYVKKVAGKNLSTNDFTNEYKNKVDSLSNYDDSELTNKVNQLEYYLNTLISGNVTNAIDTFNEIIAFLNNTEDTETLDGILSGINRTIASVEAKIPTRVSELENDKSYVTSTELDDKLAGFVPGGGSTGGATNAQVQALQAAIIAETDRAKGVETLLAERITQETANSNAAYTRIDSEWKAALKEEQDRAALVEQSLSESITAVNNKIPSKVSELENDSEYITNNDITHLATKEEVSDKQDIIDDLEAIREGANRHIPSKVSELENDNNYLIPSDVEIFVTEQDITDILDSVAQSEANSSSALTQSNQAKVTADVAKTQSDVAIESIKSLQGLSNADEAMVELAKQITQIAQNTSDIQLLRDRHQPPMTEEQFQAIEEAGELKEGTFYYIYEE